ncbi:Ornithine decarboxylase antizyme 2 [Mactra antiquata]
MLKASQAIVIDENFGPKSIEAKADMPALNSTNMLSSTRQFIRLDSCYGYSNTLTSESQTASNLCFIVRVAPNVEVAWETIFVDRRLFVEIPGSILPEGSKESLVTLLEYAEEVLECSHVILVFKKARNDRANLIRTFMFLGFQVVVPGDPIVPKASDVMFLAYAIDNYDSDD